MGRVRNLSGVNFLSVQFLGENNILAGIGDILLNFLWILIFVITFFLAIFHCDVLSTTGHFRCASIKSLFKLAILNTLF